jgi:predicted dehydrogenase
MNILRVGIVGCGIGQAHAWAFQSLREQFEVLAICDIDGARAEKVAAEFDVPLALTDLAELCQMDDLDVIDICTPSFLHVSQVEQVLAAGKHAICEKPLAGSLHEVDRLEQAEARSGRRVMPIFQYRYGHGVQKLRFLIDEGIAGRAFLTTVETAWRRRPEYYAAEWRGKWQTELGGPLVTLAIHAHDLLYYILGPARRVFAHTATLVNPTEIETEDTVAASLAMADGSLACLAVTTGSSAEISRHRFCFSHLTAESNTQPYANTSDPWTFTGDSPELQQRIDAALSRFSPQPEGYEGQFARFYTAMQESAELPVTLSDARAALELVTAAYHSAETGRPVTLPIGEEHPKYQGWQPLSG